MARQVRFSFSDRDGRPHSLVGIETPGTALMAAALDGSWVALAVEAGRARYRHGGLEFEVREAPDSLSCGGREFAEMRTGVVVTEAILARYPLGPANELVEKFKALPFLRQSGWVPPEEMAAPEAPAFHDQLEEYTPQLYVTPLVVALNALVWLGVLLAGRKGESADERLLAWGALYSPLVKEGQVWRVLSCAFLHLGFFHLFFNMLALWKVGLLVERIVGNAGFAGMYLVTGACGSAASLLVSPGTLSVGASGAVFGVFGCLLGLLTRYHVHIYTRHVVLFALVIATLLVSNIAENRGARVPRIDMGAHVGGLLAGIACGVALNQRLGPHIPAARRSRNLGVAAGGILVMLLLVPFVRKVPDVLSELREFSRVDRRVQARLKGMIARTSKREITPDQLADSIEADILPEWNAATARLTGMKNAPARFTPLLGPLGEFGGELRVSYETLVKALREQNPGILKDSQSRAETAQRRLVELLRE